MCACQKRIINDTKIERKNLCKAATVLNFLLHFQSKSFCFYANVLSIIRNAKFHAEASNPSANIYVSAIVGRINLAIYWWENSRRSVLLNAGNLFILTFQAQSSDNLLGRVFNKNSIILVRILIVSTYHNNWHQSTFLIFSIVN